MIKILVSDSMSEDGLAPLLKDENIEVVQKNVSEVEDQLDQFDALLVRSATKVTTELLDKMPNLKIVGRAGVGVDNIDINAATEHGVVVINAPDGNTISTAEHTFAMMASMLRNIPQAVASVKSGKWDRKSFQGNEIYGKRLGIVGMGRIGSELAKRARVFGMSVTAFDPFLTQERAEKMGVELATLDQVLETADIITVHTPLTKETRGLLNRDTLSKTKKGVFLLNCARGGIIDEDALAEFIENGHVAGAALDVFVEEPPTNTRLVGLDKLICTPHLGASTVEAQENVATQVSEEVLQFLSGKPVTNSINLPTISKEVYQKIQPYYELSSRMGALASQCMREPVKEIKLFYGGKISELDTTILTRSLIAGFLRPRVDKAVNEVNAAMIAQERGITYGEKVTSETNGYSNSIQVEVIGEYSTFTVKGTHVKNYGSRIVNINGFETEFNPEGNIVYIHHTDRPGVIGKVGLILGNHEVNIATMTVGRKEAGGEAIMILSFDKPLNDEVYSDLSNVDDIVSIKKIEL